MFWSLVFQSIVKNQQISCKKCGKFLCKFAHNNKKGAVGTQNSIVSFKCEASASLPIKNQYSQETERLEYFLNIIPEQYYCSGDGPQIPKETKTIEPAVQNKSSESTTIHIKFDKTQHYIFRF